MPDERYPWEGPRTIEHWDEQREAQTISSDLKNVEPTYDVDKYLSPEKELEAFRRSRVPHPYKWPGMTTVLVGVKDGNHPAFKKKAIVRVRVTYEDFSGYVYENRSKSVRLRMTEPSNTKTGCECLACQRDRDVTQLMCWKRGVEQPITFDKHLARAAVCPALEDVNEYELTAKMVQKRAFGYWAPFEYRPDVKVEVSKRSKVNGELLLPHESLWCKTCVTRTVLTEVDEVKVVLEQRGTFVAQGHTCSTPTVTKDSMSLDRLWSWLNHRVAHYVNTPRLCLWGRSNDGSMVRVLATPRQWVYAHPVVTRTLSPRDGMPVCLSWTFTDKCIQLRLRMTCKVCNAAHLAHCAEVADLLPMPRCKHLGILPFQFTDRSTITLCKDCGKTTGHDVLLFKNIFQPNKEMVKFYDLVLVRFGLSMYVGLHKEHLSYYAPSTLLTKHHAIVKETLVGGKRVNLHSWVDDSDWQETTFLKGRVVIQEGNDYGVRDQRANEIVKQDRTDKKAKTRDVRVAKRCPYSKCPRKGEPFIDRPNKKYCSENCGKRHSEERKSA